MTSLLERVARGGVEDTTVEIEARLANDLVYETDSWTREMYADEAAQPGPLKHALQNDCDRWVPFCREVFARLYQPRTPKLAEPAAGTEWANDLHEMADQLPEWLDAAGHAQGDEWMSGIAAGTIGRVLKKRLPKPPEDTKELQRQLQQHLDATANNQPVPEGPSPDELQRRIGEAGAAAFKMQAAIRGDDVALRSAMRAAAAEASKEMAETQEAIGGLTAGTGGPAPSREELRAALDNPDVKRIAALAGRMKRRAAMKQAAKTVHGREETVGIECGADLQRLLPSELAKLNHPLLSALLFARLHERGALQYQMRGKEESTEGPIIFCVDESSSMQGPRNLYAKAFLLGVASIAARQKRSFAVVHFSTQVRTHIYQAGMSLMDVRNDVQLFLSGGTEIGLALATARDLIEQSRESGWAEGRKADVVLLTDGDTTDLTKAVGEARRITDAGASLFTVIVANSAYAASPQAIADVSTQVIVTDGVIGDGDVSSLDPVFSI